MHTLSLSQVSRCLVQPLHFPGRCRGLENTLAGNTPMQQRSVSPSDHCLNPHEIRLHRTARLLRKVALTLQSIHTRPGQNFASPLISTQTLAVGQDFVLKSIHSVALTASWLGIASQLWQKPGMLMNIFPTLVLPGFSVILCLQSSSLLHISTPSYIFHRL